MARLAGVRAGQEKKKKIRGPSASVGMTQRGTSLGMEAAKEPGSGILRFSNFRSRMTARCFLDWVPGRARQRSAALTMGAGVSPCLLFADAEVAEDGVQDVGGGDFARDRSERASGG